MMLHKLNRIHLYFWLIFFVVILVFPFIWLISSSLKEGQDIFQPGISLIARDESGNIRYTFDHYVNAFRYMNFGIMFANTFFVATIATVCNLILNSMAGYAFARMRFKGRDFLFKAMLTSLMIPGAVMLVPNMVIITKMGLYNSLWALILPFMMSVYNIFLMRQHFLTLPRELEEAAIMDGCSWLGVFWRIAVPLSKPVLVILGVFTFMWNYNNFMWALVVLNDPDKYTLPLGLSTLINKHNPEKYPIMLAASVVVAAPLIAMFFFLQKHIIKGITAGAVKG
jgi:ABC-type glycerol-3-phosphate transport system permease component